ncbi:Prohormone-1 [Orchesella cincta]|uniref:Prohormone-1 n=1 Tax=Orchesella cincta TaxID=48709 RepID=A0A1D2NDS3_ORCCI|nr:Prohormone-1 [Orchesella cincta]
MQGGSMKSPATASWTMAKVIVLAVPLILLAVNNSFAAPATSNEDQIGFAPARQVFRSRENPPLAEYNIVPLIPDPGIPAENTLDNQQNVEALLKYLLARNSYFTNRLRPFSTLDSAGNELARKRSSYSRSRYCAFNAVSCFGRKK